MAKVEIYSTLLCGYCARAKALLGAQGRRLREYRRAEPIPSRRDEMVERAGGRTTVPQIFIDGVHVGGSDDLARARPRRQARRAARARAA